MRIAVIGSGLIGGSIGLALKAASPAHQVVAFDVDPSTSEQAVGRGAADRAETSVSAAAAEADVVFVCVPVGDLPAVAIEAAGSAPQGAIITDVGSTKTRVVLEVSESLPEGVTFVGGHPMAGSEEEGIVAARADLFVGAWWILTPNEGEDAPIPEPLEELLAALGARSTRMTPRAHDELMAMISHVPQLLASALMSAAIETESIDRLALAAGGFRDATRVAASNPAIWVPILRENRAAVLAGLDAVISRLSVLREQVDRSDDGDLTVLLRRAREARRRLPVKPTRPSLTGFNVPVPDRPGVLAEVSAIAGELGVNIEDLAITHGAGGAQGILHVWVASSADRDRLIDGLRGRGYRPIAAGGDQP